MSDPDAGVIYENPVTGEHGVVLEGPQANGSRILVLLTVRPHGAVVGEHIHPNTAERFEVIEGELGTRVDGVERVILAGEVVAVPAGHAHDWWNAGEDEAKVLVEVSPAGRFAEMIGTVFALARAGETDSRGRPSPLQVALLAREYDDVVEFTKPPRWIQRPLFALLAPLARARGLSGSRDYGERERISDAELAELRSRYCGRR